MPKKYYNYLAEVKKSEINQKFKISEIALITELFDITYYYLAERNEIEVWVGPTHMVYHI